MNNTPPQFIAFQDNRRIATGPLAEMSLRLQALMTTSPNARVLVFDASSSEQIDIDHSGTPEQMLQALAVAHPAAMCSATPDTPCKPAPAGPGRPKLGVVAREVTLLPRHWEWLGSQPGGASVALRKLVDLARRDNQGQEVVRLARESAYRFMSAMAGDRVGFEDAARALFAGERQRFVSTVAAWPRDIGEHLNQLAVQAWPTEHMQEPQHA